MGHTLQLFAMSSALPSQNAMISQQSTVAVHLKVSMQRSPVLPEASELTQLLWVHGGVSTPALPPPPTTPPLDPAWP